MVVPQVDTPEYYRVPFHTYPEGNLCWQAALEVDPSAISVHANIYTTEGQFEAQGDDRLRSNFHRRMMEMMPVSDENVLLWTELPTRGNAKKKTGGGTLLFTLRISCQRVVGHIDGTCSCIGAQHLHRNISLNAAQVVRHCSSYIHSL